MGQLTFLQLLGHQFTRLPDVASFAADLSGKTVLVTGANGGLGYEAAKHFARMGPAKLILACRDETKGGKAAETIASETGCTTVECWKMDLASFTSVREFGDRFAREGGGKLDILVENAAISGPEEWTVLEGWESVLKVNHLGTWHLGLRLLPFLLAAQHTPGTPGPRLVVVTSELHFWMYEAPALESSDVLGTLNDESKREKGSMFGIRRYGTSKLFNILFIRALARLLPTSSASNPFHLTCNAVNPGFCHSGLVSPSFAMSVRKAILARSTEVGSRTLVHAAVAKELEGKSGEYLDSCEVGEASDLLLREKGEALERKVWDETLKVLFEVDPELKGILDGCGLQV